MDRLDTLREDFLPHWRDWCAFIAAVAVCVLAAVTFVDDKVNPKSEHQTAPTDTLLTFSDTDLYPCSETVSGIAKVECS